MKNCACPACFIPGGAVLSRYNVGAVCGPCVERMLDHQVVTLREAMAGEGILLTVAERLMAAIGIYVSLEDMGLDEREVLEVVHALRVKWGFLLEDSWPYYRVMGWAVWVK